MRYTSRYRIVAWLCLLALVLTLTAACGRRPAANSPQPQLQESGKTFPVTLTDALGRQVTLDKAPERIISLIPSNTEILFSLGLGDRIVGVNDNDNYPPEVTKKEKIGGAFDLQNTNIEKIVSLKPDLILGGAIQKPVVEELAKLNLTIYAMPDAATVQEAISSIATVGDLTGTKSEAEKLIASLNARVEAVVAKVKDQPKPKVFHEVWGDPLMTAGPGSFIDDMIKLAGGTNIAADAASAYPQFSLESLVERNPDVITTPFKQTADDLAAGKRQNWKGLRAVKEGRVVVLDQDIISRPGPRIVDGLEAFARAIHPELFK